MRDKKGLAMECEGPQYLKCGMLEPSITTPPGVTIVSSSKYMTMPQELVYQCLIILLIKVKFDRFLNIQRMLVHNHR